MFQETEMIALMLGLITLTATLYVYQHIRSIYPGSLLLVVALFFVVLTEIASIVESVFWPDVFNGIEHVFHFLSIVILAAWTYWVFCRRRKPG